MAEILRTILNLIVWQDECLAKDVTWSECIRLTHVTADSGCPNFVTWSRWSYAFCECLSKIAVCDDCLYLAVIAGFRFVRWNLWHFWMGNWKTRPRRFLFRTL